MTDRRLNCGHTPEDCPDSCDGKFPGQGYYEALAGKKPSPNERQVGGAHYQSSYQYWDFVRDVGLGYHAGNAGKYVSRAYKKNGAEDVQKGLHYIDKCDEIDDEGSIYSEMVCAPLIAKFVVANDLDEKQAMALTSICQGDWEAARLWTAQLG